MDIKSIIVVVCVAVSGFLLFQNQQRSRELYELTKNRLNPADVALAKNAGGDAELIAAIRAEVIAQLAASAKNGDPKGGLGPGEMIRLQEMRLKMDDFDRRFKLSMDRMLAPDDEDTFIRAQKIVTRVTELCKK
jgi:hypothetical protein